MRMLVIAAMLIVSGALAGHAWSMDMSDMDMNMDMGHDTADQTPSILLVMKRKFETAEKPLIVDPVVVEGGWAIVGWEQQGRGGRVLLSKGHAGWVPVICSGDGLKDVAVLQKAGLPPDAAESLSRKLSDAEGRLDPQSLVLLSSFVGTVSLGVPGQPGEAHGDHAGHAK